MAVQKVTWIPREDGVFDGIADTWADFSEKAAECGTGSIIYVVSEDAYMVKRPDGSWMCIPESILKPPTLPDPLPPNYLEERRREIMLYNQIKKWRDGK